MSATSARFVVPPHALPWLDRAGRLSFLKLATFVALFLPGLWLALQWGLNQLGSKPVTAAIHETGVWAVRFLLLSLAVTPMRFIGNWPKLFLIRRMLGLAALFYVLIHLYLYVVQEAFDLAKVASEIVLRFYLTIGFVALLGLVALGVTSTDAMIRRLGENWHRLHRIVYALMALALLHFFLQRKIDVTESVLMTGLFLLLIAYRLMRRWRVAYDPLPLALVAVAGGAVTMLIEAGWYATATGVPPLAVLKANLDFSFTIRPGWWVAAAGVAVVALRILRPPPQSRRVREAARAT